MRITIWRKAVSALKALFGQSGDFISIVLLLREPRQFDEADLRDAAERAWEVRLETGNDAKNFLVIEKQIRFIKVQGHFFNVLNAAKPYIERAAEAASAVRNDLVKSAVLVHRAWLSVDYMGPLNPKLTIDERYAAAGKLIAEFVDQNCLAICIPDKNVIVPATPFAVKILRNMTSPKDLLKAIHENR